MQTEQIDTKTLLKKNLQLAGRCIIITLLCAVISFVIFASFTVIAVSLGTNEIGYTVLYSADNGESYTKVYTYYLSDGEDKQLAKYIDKEGYHKEIIRSELSESSKRTIAFVSQMLGLALLFSMLYGATWKLGDSDENRVAFGHMKKDKFRGLKIGFLATAPYAFVWFLLLLSKAGLFLESFPKTYKIIHYHLFFFTDLTLGFATKTATQLTWNGTAMALLLLLPVPLFCMVGYISGYRHLILKNKIIYQNDKKGR